MVICFVALAVLAILGSIEQFWFDETWLSILASDQCILLITAGLLLCLLGWSLIPTSKLAKINRLLKACLLVASIVLLFVVRTLVAYVTYEIHTPNARYMVSADAHIHTLVMGFMMISWVLHFAKWRLYIILNLLFLLLITPQL